MPLSRTSQPVASFAQLASGNQPRLRGDTLTAVKYGEGTWFAVPLRTQGYAVGLIAGQGARGVLLGYFFGPARVDIPALADMELLKPEGAAAVLRFGDLHLRDGAWPLIGQSRAWRRAAWPIPVFGRYEELSGRHLQVTFPDDFPPRGREVAVDERRAAGLPRDDLYGAGAVELALTRLTAGAR